MDYLFQLLKMKVRFHESIGRLTILLGLSLFVGNNLVGQPLTWNENNKYWSYRNRLINKFVVRGADNNDCNDPSGLSIPAKLAFTYESKIRWADGGAQLGWYMGVLATECQQEALSGSPSEKTLRIILRDESFREA